MVTLLSYYLLLTPAGRYHEGVQPGDVSQTGQLLLLLLDSVAQQGCYSQQDYCARLDGLLDTLDGTPYSGKLRKYIPWTWEAGRAGLVPGALWQLVIGSSLHSAYVSHSYTLLM